jgi:hypothetical protein
VSDTSALTLVLLLHCLVHSTGIYMLAASPVLQQPHACMLYSACGLLHCFSCFRLCPTARCCLFTL